MSEWRDIPGWNGRYQVSDEGQIRSTRPGRMKLRKIDIQRSGHHAVLLVNPRKKMLVHRAVALAFIGPQPPGKPCVTHQDGNPANNAPINLRWATYKENVADKRRLGEHAKLTKEDVERIRALRGVQSTRALAREYGVGPGHISRVQRNILWG